MEHLKSKVHVLTNHMQAVMGYLELEEYGKALTEVRRAIKELRALAKMISGFKPFVPDAVVTVPKDAVVVIPDGVVVVSPEKVDMHVPNNVVAIVPRNHMK